MLLRNFYWTRIINLIIRTYLADTTICILWNEDIDFELDIASCNMPAYAVININKKFLKQSFEVDVLDYGIKREELISNEVYFDALIEKLTMSIEKSYCESFLAFQSDIPMFAEAFTNASKYSSWRSMRNKFIFAYNTELAEENYFHHYLFEDQSSILLIERPDEKSIYFNLKTNKYVGLRAEHPKSIILLDRFNAATETFDYGVNLFPDKIKDLQGREVIMAAFDYRPDIVIDYANDKLKNVRDYAYENPEDGAAMLDGVEARVLLTFCEKYNCTVGIDTSEADDWGVVYPNRSSGNGALGMIAKHKAEISMGAMYSWYVDYLYLDMSMYIRRSGITCVVPAPRRLASLLLPLEPFQPVLWGFVIACLCVEVLSLLTVRSLDQIVNKIQCSWLRNFKISFTSTLKLFVSQSSRDNVKSVSVRVLLFSCFIIDIVVTSIYGGGLASILTVPSFEQAADTLERLESFKLKWASNSEAWVMSIRGSDDPRMNAILENFHIYTDEELAQLARTEYMGFTIERLPFGHFAVENFYTQDILERFKIMIDDIYFQYTVAFTSRLWPMLTHYDQLIYNWHSSGFDKYWEWRISEKYLNGHVQKQIESSMYTNFESMGPIKLGMSNFVGILLIWVLGVTFSVVAFIGEVSYSRLHKTKVEEFGF